MQSAGLYNRQSILQRKPKTIVDRNFSLSEQDWAVEQKKFETKKQKITLIHEERKSIHFGSPSEKKTIKDKIKKDADLVQSWSEQKKSDEILRRREDDQKMIAFHSSVMERDRLRAVTIKDKTIRASEQNCETAAVKDTERVKQKARTEIEAEAELKKNKMGRLDVFIR